MFLEFYGLNEQPFGVTPDPRFLYLGSKHRGALAALDYGTESNRGFLALIARPGMGKTSLLFQYLESLRDRARTVFLFQTDCNAHDLMRCLLADVGLDGAGKDLPEMRSMLNKILLEEMRVNRRFVLVIDEAQSLSDSALESIRLLSNFETPWAKLMQIVIAGQPQLAQRLAAPSMVQLRQRVSFFVRLEPLSYDEITLYIDHRLFVAGYKGPQLFTVGARRLICHHSEGIPRVINNICFAAMSLAWALGRQVIDREMVQEVLVDINPASAIPKLAVSPKSQEVATAADLHTIEENRPPRDWLPLAGSRSILGIAETRASQNKAGTLASAPPLESSHEHALPEGVLLSAPTGEASANEGVSINSGLAAKEVPTQSEGTTPRATPPSLYTGSK